MTRMPMTFLALALTAATFGCSSNEASDRLLSGEETPGEGASQGSLYNNHQDPLPGAVSAQQRKAEEEKVGSPEVYARLHACGKITIHSLGRILATRGVSPQGGAFALYNGGITAFGAANYGSRSPEVVVASTANMTKAFDILVTAAPEMLANVGAPEGACPGIKLYENGSFTKDGLACVMGKPAGAEHLFLANQAVKDAVAAGISEEDGKSIAVASLLQAAHTCE